MTLPKQSMVWSPVRPQAEWNQSVKKAKNWKEKNTLSMLDSTVHTKSDFFYPKKTETDLSKNNHK